MGFLTRLLVPRKVRRVAHPVRTVRRAVTPRPIRRASYQLWSVRHPVRRATHQAVYGAVKGKRRRAQVYRHGTCPVRHRTPEAAARCRRTH